MKTKYIYIALFGVLFICTNIFSQQINTVYFMKNIEERKEYNPAFQPIYNVYWDLPITPNYKFEAGNNSLNFSDCVYKQNVYGIDSLITALHPLADKDKFLNSLKSTTRINYEHRINLIGFGFRVKKNYFSFNIAQRASVNLFLPKDLFRLAIYGTDTLISRSYNLDKFGVNAISYTEFGLGYSRIINDKLTLGLTIKYLQGQSHLSTDIDRFKLSAGLDEWVIDGKGTMNASIPDADIPLTSENIIDFANVDMVNSKISDFIWTGNWGLGLDLGATYKIIPNLELSAALTDLGFIRWRNNVINANYNGNYNFQGVSYQVDDDMKDKIDSLSNDLEDAFSLYGSKKAYTSYLSSRLNLGAEYSVLKDRIGFGLLSSTLFTNKSAFSDLTTSINMRPYNWFSTSVSYSLLDGQWSCLGLGLQLKMLPFNMYIAMDHIPLTYSSNYIPLQLSSFNIQAGCVVAFGDPKKVGDDDKDGVKNKKDKCPNTPYGWLVDKDGCTVDTDKDGVPDNLDKCPNTPANTPVDSVGCPLDDDKDGVLNLKDICPNTPEGVKVDSVGCPLDTDKDKVADYLDKCPDTPLGAPVDSVGCPLDTDGDGVADYLDKCPNTPLEARATVDSNGCSKDSDGDGVPDYLDKCPNTPIEARGKVDANGCPLDTDLDNVPDYLDNCPTIKGSPTNHGCPEVQAAVKKLFEKALQGIQFQTGKAIIKSTSNGILNDIVKVMKENPSYLIDINGHTDNVGKAEANQILSEKRANAVKDYLSSHGVDASRIKAKGYGDMIPVETNTTPAGRAKNRRVEFIVRFEE